MESNAFSSSVIFYVPVAILALGIITFCMQATLCVRYLFGSWRLRSWNQSAPQEWLAFLTALAELQHRKIWAYRFLNESGQALGITSGQFRIEYATELFREKEDSLFRHAFARFATASLLIFGLAGTFWAFIHLVSGSGLVSALEQLTTGEGDQTVAYLELSSAFLAALGGFGQAFWASLAGLAATLVLSFTNQLFVEILRSKFMHAWSSIAHDWEQRMLDERKFVEAVPEEPKLSPYAPLPADATGPEIMRTLSVVNSALDDASKTQERWQQLINALDASRDFQVQALASIAEAGADQRTATQNLVDNLIFQVKSEIIPGLANEIKKVSAAKIEHFKQTEEGIAQHLKALEQTWAGKLDQTLATFAEQSTEVTSAAQKEVAATRSEALTAGERVAEAIRAETQNALTTFQELLKLASNSNAEMAANAQISVASAQKELAASRSEALTAGERVAEAIRTETQKALSAFQKLLDMATKSQTELFSSTHQTQEMNSEVRRLMKEDKEALSDYIQKIQQSLDAWKKAPKAIEGSLTELSSVTAELTRAMKQTAKMPSRWTEEIDQIAALLREGHTLRREASLWNKLGTKTGTAWERTTAYFRGLKK